MAETKDLKKFKEWMAKRGFLPAFAQGVLEIAQAVDAVEVVRCKKCIFAKPYERMDGEIGYFCKNSKNSFTYGQSWDRQFNPVKEANDFCSYGERKENG